MKLTRNEIDRRSLAKAKAMFSSGRVYENRRWVLTKGLQDIHVNLSTAYILLQAKFVV